DEAFYADVAADQAGRATMSLLLPPQMLNTMAPHGVPTTAGMLADPVRRYMLPVASDRLDGAAASHPYAARDSLHEHEMWAVEGLTHRYPTKVLAELLSTCPQYCGHCTRMDLVGNSTPAVPKLKFELKPVDRQTAMLEYLRATPGVRDVVVSGGDVANLPFKNLEAFVSGVLLRGVTATAGQLLDLCFRLLDGAGITPYYFYMCDMIPSAEHWRVSLAEAQTLQHDIMGYLPGFATPRIVCDVPYVGKRWVHQLDSYDRVRGISYWTKNYRTSVEANDESALTRLYEYYDPISTLPGEGQAWWREHSGSAPYDGI